MTHDPLEQVTRLLRDATSEVGDVEETPARREEAIAKLAEAIRARAAVDRRRRALGTLAVAAGVLAVVGGGWAAATHRSGAVASAPDLGRMEGEGVTVLRDGHAEAPAVGTRIAEGAELRIATGAEAKLAFDSGTQVTVGSGARVRLVEQRKQKRFALEEGWLAAKVAKLGAEERFVVTTADAEVEVRGTAFRLALAVPDPSCSVATPTRLEVSEGVVVVRHAGGEERVAAGESWPRGCVAPKSAAAPSSASPVGVASPVASVASVAVTPSPSSPGPKPAARHGAAEPARSHLSEQNDMFDAAMRDKREGRGGAAVATLDRLLARWPDGPLAESAAVERMRLLAASDRSRASRAAREYLARWPRGFARAEAEGLSGGP